MVPRALSRVSPQAGSRGANRHGQLHRMAYAKGCVKFPADFYGSLDSETRSRALVFCPRSNWTKEWYTRLQARSFWSCQTRLKPRVPALRSLNERQLCFGTPKLASSFRVLTGPHA